MVLSFYKQFLLLKQTRKQSVKRIDDIERRSDILTMNEVTHSNTITLTLNKVL